MSAQIYHRFSSEPFAISPESAVSWQRKFRYEVPAGALAKSKTDFFGDTIRELAFVDGAAIVPVDGLLLQHPSFLERGFGASAYEDIRLNLATAVDKKPKAIVLDIRSGGGSLIGCTETASAVADTARKIPTYAFCDSFAASAAYWIGCAATKFFCTPSSIIGSIGVISQFSTIARALADAGIDVETFVSSPLKAAGNSYKQASEAEKNYFQSRVDSAGGEFVSAVTKYRRGISADAFSGGIFDSKQALSLGLVDGIVSSFGEALGIATGGKSVSTMSAHTSAPDFAAQWQASPSLRNEFPDVGCYVSFKNAEAKGRVTISARQPAQRFTSKDFQNK